MADKVARAEVAQIRQTTQFTCCATSITSALHALGKPLTEDDVNKVLGAAPMAGATWEAMLATVQYFGCRGTLVVPCTPRMLKDWTDKGIPVVIAWNPEGRPWSHASTVYNVTEGPPDEVPGHCTLEGSGTGLYVWVADSNIPNPSKTTRIVHEDSFCQRWGEKVSDTLIVRRPAMSIEREVTVGGRQVMASQKTTPASRVASAWLTAKSHDVKEKRDPSVVTIKKEDLPKNRLGPEVTTRRPGGPMHNRTDDVESGRSRKPKHKQNWSDKDAENT